MTAAFLFSFAAKFMGSHGAVAFCAGKSERICKRFAIHLISEIAGAIFEAQ